MHTEKKKTCLISIYIFNYIYKTMYTDYIRVNAYRKKENLSNIYLHI